MRCPHCTAEYDESEVVCPDCGRTAYVPKSKRAEPEPAAPEPSEPENAASFPRPVGVQVKSDGSWSVGPDAPAMMPRRSVRKRPEILRTDTLLGGKPPPAGIPQALVQAAQDELERAMPSPRPTGRIRAPVARVEIPSADAGSRPEPPTLEAQLPHPRDVPEVSEEAAGTWEEIALPASTDEPTADEPVAAEPPMSVANALADSLGEAPPPVAEPEPEARPKLAAEPEPEVVAPKPTREATAAGEAFGARAEPEEVVKTVPVRAAGFWRRLIGLAVDSVPLLLIAVMLYYPIIWLMPLPEFPPAREVGIDFLVDLALREPILLLPPGLALVLGFLIYRTALQDRTVGRRLLKLSVIGLDGKAISRPREFVRSLLLLLFGVLFGLGLLWTGFDRERRGLHDRLARTVVAIG